MKIRNLALLATTMLSMHGFTAAYAAEETKDPYEDNMFGHWGGYRDKAANAGVDITAGYKADFTSVTNGGLKNGGNYLDNADLVFNFNNEKIFGLSGNTATIHFINNAGGHPNDRVGSVQGVNNIEVPGDANSFRVYEAWDEQAFFGNKFSVRAGLQDLNIEFLATDSTANFIAPIFQIGQTIAQTGLNSPSVFPFSALSARFRYNPTEETYAMAGVFDGVAGDPDHLRGNQFQFDGGLLLIAEAGCTPKAPEGVDSNPTKYALGGWMYTHNFPDLVDTDAGGYPIRQRSYGGYVLASQMLYHEKSGRMITGFLRPGFSDGDTGQTKYSYELGLVGNGWIPTREDGEIGLGFTQAHNSGKYMRSVSYASDRNEYALELYYRDKMCKGVTLQPDVQYVMNPGTTQNVDNATVFTLRLQIDF